MQKSRINRRYGWKRDIKDSRDHNYAAAHRRKAAAILPSVDLEPAFPPCFDQGDLGSCTFNGIGGVFAYVSKRQSTKNVSTIISRLMGYYGERYLEGTVDSDSGAAIRDGIKVLADSGVCREDIWPYEIEKFTQSPDDAAVKDAVLHKAAVYQRVQVNVLDVMTSLSQNLPIVFGFSVPESFEDESVARTGIMPLYNPNESIIGGHCVVIVGYDQAKQILKVRNSWGTEWGQNGYFWMPFTNFTELSSDLWIIPQVLDNQSYLNPLPGIELADEIK